MFVKKLVSKDKLIDKLLNGLIEPPPDPIPAHLLADNDDDASSIALAASSSSSTSGSQQEPSEVHVDSLKEYRQIFEKNNRMRTMTSFEIKRYITETIVPSVEESRLEHSLRINDIKEKNSALCTLL